MKTLSIAVSLLAAAAPAQDLPPLSCTHRGAVFPPPASLSASRAIRQTRCSFSALLDNLTSGPVPTEWGIPLDLANSTWSIGVFSAASSSDDLVFERHHTGANVAPYLTSAGETGRDTMYRVGSITKLLTVYALLARLGIDAMDEKVTSWIPELGGGEAGVRDVGWDSVTVGSLCSHLAGIQRALASGDFAISPAILDPDIGFVNLTEADLIPCGAFGLPDCSREEAVEIIRRMHPLAPVYGTPIYSNLAFTVVGLVYEAMTGESFASAVDDALFGPLGLDRSSWLVPEDDADTLYLTVNPVLVQDSGISRPAGDAWMSLGDLSALGRSILASSLLPEAATNRWLKPSSHTADPAFSVGMPFEIWRVPVPQSPGSPSTRVVDLYTKAGAFNTAEGQYLSTLVLSPDHGAGVALLLGQVGNTPDKTLLEEYLVRTWVPALELAAREEAAARYAGRYSSGDGDGDGAGSSSTLVIEAVDGTPGLAVAEFTFNGSDMLVLARELGAVAVGMQYLGVRGDDEVAWQMLLQPPDDGVGWYVPRKCGFFWAGLALSRYAALNIEEVIFRLGEGGMAVSVEAPWLRDGAWMRVEP